MKPEKLETIFEYCLNSIIALKKPCYPFIVTNYDYKADALLHYIEGHYLLIRLIIFDKNKVYQVLNRLNEKEYSKEEFSIEDYVLFTYCMVFAKNPYAQDVIEKLAELFISVSNIPRDLKRNLHSTLCLMIKYHFDEVEKIKELITLITDAMEEEELEDLPYNERLKLDLLKSEEKYIRSEKERIKMLSELSEKDKEITQKDKKIEKLKKILLENNIII